MNKKRLFLLSGAALVVLLVSLIGATVVFADEPEPGAEAPFCRGMGGRGAFGDRMFGPVGGDRWTMFDTMAEALGFSPVELFTELHAGKSPDEVAEAQGVDMESLQDKMKAARAEAMEEAIEQAVADGNMSQEQADWMLKGLEQGFAPMGRGFDRGRELGGRPSTDTDNA